MGLEGAVVVLIVEDDPLVRELLACTVGRPSVRVVEVGTVAGALAALETDPPDAVLLDLMLPDGHGLELCGRLAELRAGTPVKVLVVSAVGHPAQIAGALAMGCDGYLVKPFRPSALLDWIAQWSPDPDAQPRSPN